MASLVENLQEVVESLISRRAEGTYWDFKRCHHRCKADLIHDVLCLSNAKHQGCRFLIFGIDSEDYTIHSITDDSRRRTQADIAGLFRDNASKFFQSKFPEFYMVEVSVNGTILDILVILNTPDKPYYLVVKYGKIQAHHIYTRVCDTNTPSNTTAQPHEIERMWRERFGLDLTPLARVKGYLNDFKSWVSINRYGEDFPVHHRIFPEFTMKITTAEEYMACNEEWTRGEVRCDDNHALYYEVYYHQTCLAQVRWVSFDNLKKSMIAPNWEPRGAGRFYFYESESVNYAVQQFHSALEKKDHSISLSIKGQCQISNEARERWGHKLRIPVLSTGELDKFLSTSSGEVDLEVELSSDRRQQYELFLRNQLDFENWRDEYGKSRKEE